jgi:hypothetical protein
VSDQLLVPGGPFEKVMKLMETALYSDRERVANQDSAIAALQKAGVPMGVYNKTRYTNAVRRGITRAVEDGSAFRDLVTAERANRARLYPVREAELKDWPTKPIEYLTVKDEADGDRVVDLCKGRADITVVSAWQFGSEDAAIKLLERYSVPIGKQCVVIRVASILEEPDLELDDPKILRYIDDIIARRFRASEGDVIPSPAWREFAWQRTFIIKRNGKIIDEKTAPSRTPVCPVAGLDPLVQTHIRQMGVSTFGDAEAIQVTKMLNKITNQPGFPTDIRPETILSAAMHPSIARDPRNLTSLLVSMGSDPAKAAAFSQNAFSTLGTLSMLGRVKTYSTTDMVTGNFDFSHANYRRLVNLEGSEHDSAIAGVARGLAMNVLVTAPMWEPFQHVDAEILTWRIGDLKQIGKGRFSDPGEQFLFKSVYQWGDQG